MTSSVRVRATALLTAVALALGASACGGGDDGAQDEQYVKAWNGVCERLTNDLATLQAELAASRNRVPADALKTPERAAEVVLQLSTPPLNRYLDAVQQTYASVTDLAVPPRFARFHDQTVKALPALVTSLAATRRQIARGKLADVPTSFATAVLDLQRSAPMPDDLRHAAPACEQAIGKA